LPGETIIPRNFGQAPGAFVLNLRVSRAFAFGDVGRGNAARPQVANAPLAAGGPRMVGAGPGPQGGAPPSEKRFNLNVSINFQNLLNRANLSTPVGNLSSPNFGESLGLGGSFGGFSGGGSSGAGNRRVYAQVRLNF
jgi:hypothetical protein